MRFFSHLHVCVYVCVYLCLPAFLSAFNLVLMSSAAIACRKLTFNGKTTEQLAACILKKKQWLSFAIKPSDILT